MVLASARENHALRDKIETSTMIQDHNIFLVWMIPNRFIPHNITLKPMDEPIRRYLSPA